MLRQKRGYLAAIGLLLALVVIFIIWYATYFRKTPADQSSSFGYNADKSGGLTIFDSTRKKIEDINRKAQERNKF